MTLRVVRALIVSATASLLLGGCETTFTRAVGSLPSAQSGPVAAAEPETTGSVPPPPNGSAVADALLGSDPGDDLSLGKRHFQEQNYGLAERHFRRAVEKLPRDGEAWLGLAAAYDQLRRFELADRAYGQAIAVLGPTPEVLNNQGYSFLMRGDFRRARAKLTEALHADPANARVRANVELLDEVQRRGKGLR